jgi:beta-galactosidase/beta-glucuronidase
MTEIPRPEHPKPQFERANWLNLNGAWRFAFDFGVSGVEQGWPADPAALDREIVVPFCPESRLSGVQHTDFIPAVWYHRTFRVPSEWRGQRVFLHFGGVDYDCRAWVNGKLVGRHYGGSSSFCFDLTAALRDGGNELVVCALDDVRSSVQASGKQCPALNSHGCLYTRVTGIWQTVWLEARPATHLESVRVVPDLDGERFVATPTIRGGKRGLQFRATVLADGAEVRCITRPATSGAAFCLALDSPRAWSPADPFLYDLRFELLEGDTVIDPVSSYAGLRKFHVEGNRLFLNNQPFFARFVLDQGFYPDGIWTAPSDAELRADVERSLAVGFNGARLHQKVFEERFHYWADKLGYLTWGEFADWGGSHSFGSPQGIHNYQREWREVVMRDLNHPSIVAWTPFNETAGGARANTEAHRRAVQETVDLTRALDPTRPVNDTSGYVHVDTDLYTVHCYEQDPAKFRDNFAAVAPDAREGFHINVPDLDVGYAGQPFVVDEYGGTWWNEEMAAQSGGSDTAERKQSWGYGKTPESLEEVYHRLEELTKVLTSHPHIAGYCYTQLTDVEQEQNGVYTYDRKAKFDAARLRQYFGAPAAIEQGE